VFSEAQRVFKFKETCDLAKDNALEELGKLMDQSHFSCSQLYECSCTELDELTQICRYLDLICLKINELRLLSYLCLVASNKQQIN